MIGFIKAIVHGQILELEKDIRTLQQEKKRAVWNLKNKTKLRTIYDSGIMRMSGNNQGKD